VSIYVEPAYLPKDRTSKSEEAAYAEAVIRELQDLMPTSAPAKQKLRIMLIGEFLILSSSSATLDCGVPENRE
jgi:hypothetical protein